MNKSLEDISNQRDLPFSLVRHEKMEKNDIFLCLNLTEVTADGLLEISFASLGVCLQVVLLKAC